MHGILLNTFNQIEKNTISHQFRIHHLPIESLYECRKVVTSGNRHYESVKNFNQECYLVF